MIAGFQDICVQLPDCPNAILWLHALLPLAFLLVLTRVRSQLVGLVCLQALEPKLKKIEAAKKKSATHLKNKHPPKFKSKQPEPARDEIKLALQKASIEYHPDKQGTYDKEWHILAREISKAVNGVWADYKG